MVSFREQIYQKIDGNGFSWIDLYDFFEQDKVHLHRWPIFIFLISAMMCLLGSATFHLYSCMSSKLNKILLRLDYAGVCFLIAGTPFPPMYYGFYCRPVLSTFYLIVGSSLSGVVFVISMFDFIHTPKYFIIKGYMYGSLGISAAFPLFHLFFDEYLTEQNGFSFGGILPYYLLMGSVYLFGLAIYMSRYPEVSRPGNYDICGQSH